MYSLEVMIPAAVSQGDLNISQPAPRPASLDGKTVGLLWNDKRGGRRCIAAPGPIAAGAVPRREGQLLQGTARLSAAVARKGPVRV